MPRNHTPASAPLTTTQQLASLVKSARDIMRKDRGLSGDLDRLPQLTWIMFLKFLDDMEKVREDEAKLEGKRFKPAIEAPYRWRDWACDECKLTGDDLTAFINNDEARGPDGKRSPGLFKYLRGLQGANGGDRRDVIASVFKDVVNRMVSGYLLRDVVSKVNGIHFDSTEEIHTLGNMYETMLREMRDAAGDSGEFYTPRPVVRFIVEVINPKLGEVVLDPACGTGGFLVEAYKHLEQQCRTVEQRRILQKHSIIGGEAKPLPYLLCQMNLLLHGMEYPTVNYGNSLAVRLSEIGDRDRVDVIMTNPPFGGEEERGILGNFPSDRQTAETALLFLQLIMRKLRRSPTPGRAAVVVPESTMGDPGVAQRIRKELVDEFNLRAVLRLPKGVFEPYSDIQTNVLFFDRAGVTGHVWYYQHEVPIGRRSMRNPCYTATLPLQFDELKPVLAWWADKHDSDLAWRVTKDAVISRDYTLDFRNPRREQSTARNPKSLVAGVLRSLRHATDSVEKLASQDALFGLIDTGPWSRRPLSDFLARAKQEENLHRDVEYKQITVKLYGRGVVLRCVQRGDAIRTRPQYRADAGQLIMSRIDARNGAFGIVPPDLDGAVVTQDFPLFRIDGGIVEPAFLALLLRSEAFTDACKRASRGTTNRKRLREELFLRERVPIPPRDVQMAAVTLANSLEEVGGSALGAASTTEEALWAIANYVSK